MTADIVQRLRASADEVDADDIPEMLERMEAAAVEIKQLRAKAAEYVDGWNDSVRDCDALRTDVADLTHDIARHIQVAVDLMQENERLRAENADLRTSLAKAGARMDDFVRAEA